MNKTTKVAIIAVVMIVIAVIAIVIGMNTKTKSNLAPIQSAEDLSALVDKLYEGQEMELASLMTQTIDVTDDAMVQTVTGLENGEKLEYAVVSEPMMSSQAYSLVLVKVKEGCNANEIAKTMNENIDERKWICVTAEKVYTTSSGDVICLVMSNEEVAKPIYEKFKTLAGGIGQEFERTAQEAELPEDMY